MSTGAMTFMPMMPANSVVMKMTEMMDCMPATSDVSILYQIVPKSVYIPTKVMMRT